MISSDDALSIAHSRHSGGGQKQSALWRIVLAVLLCVCAYLATLMVEPWYEHTGLPESRIEISSVFFSSGSDPTPLEGVSFGREITLPESWPEAGHLTSQTVGTGWYTAVLPLNVPPNRLWVIYFPNITANSSIYLNGEVLGSGMRLDEWAGQMRQRPLYLNIPNGMLRAGDNLLQISVTAGYEFFGSIEPFYLGPEQSFRNVYSQKYFLRVTLVKIIGIMLFFASLSAGLIWYLRQTEKLYGWFALSCLLWSVVILTDFTRDYSEALGYLKLVFRYSSITLFAALLFVVINRFLQLRPGGAERISWICCILICGCVMVAPKGWMHSVCNYLVGAYALTMISSGFYLIMRNYLKTGGLSAYLVGFAIAVLFFFAVGDLIEALSPSGLKYSGMTSHYGAPLFVIILGVLLIGDFVEARDRAEELNRTLEQRIERKVDELEASFESLQQLRKQQILAEERDRLLMEMHDGLGGQLINVMSMLEVDDIDKSDVSKSVREALDDLRLMIEAFDPECDDLAMLLGGYRARLERSLGRAVKLVWEVADVPRIEGFGPHDALQVLRILQESVTNAVKYSGATQITIATGVQDNKVFLEVSDNGRGMRDISDSDGRGLKNMHRRAASINAGLSIDSESDGVSLRLILNDKK